MRLVPNFGLPAARTGLALALVVLSLVAAVGGLLRWRIADTGQRRGVPPARMKTMWILPLGLAVIAVLLGVLIATGSGHR